MLHLQSSRGNRIMNISALVVVVVVIGAQSVVYHRYISGRISHKTGLFAIAGLSFVTVFTISLFVPLTGETLCLLFFSATSVASGSAIGAWRARRIALSGIAEYERRQRDDNK